jgi:hypothetical protein
VAEERAGTACAGLEETEGGLMKVAELEGALLDYWVAKAEELTEPFIYDGSCQYWVSDSDENDDRSSVRFHPSRDWAQGGQIIERESINILRFDDPKEPWAAVIYQSAEHWIDTSWFDIDWHGATPLVAAMRCYVASKFGEEVQDAQPESVG